jgi:hypothetical protein
MAEEKPSGKARKIKAADTAAMVNNVAKALDHVHNNDRPPKPKNILLPEPHPLDTYLKRIPVPEAEIASDKEHIDIYVCVGRGRDQDDVD